MLLKLNDILRLRKIDGLDGHPDLSTKGIEANTGSLGMGISKAKEVIRRRSLKITPNQEIMRM